MEYRYRKNKKLRFKKKSLAILFLIIAIIIAFVFWFTNREGPYEKYYQYDENNKKIGEVQHYQKENEQFFISLYYPKTNIKELNKIINDCWNDYIKDQKANKDSKDILYMDYSIDQVYKQYVNLKLSMNRYNEDDKLVEQSNKLFCYDTKNEKVLTVNDVLRKNYKISLANINGIDNIDQDNDNLEIKKDKVVIYTNDKLKEKVEIKYEENKDLIRLANKNIPSKMLKLRHHYLKSIQIKK